MPQKPRQQIPITSSWNRMIDFIEWPVKIVRCDNKRKIGSINHNQLRSLHEIYIDYKYTHTHSIRCKIGNGARFVVVKVIVDISLFRIDAHILTHGLKLNNLPAIWLTYSIFDRERECENFDCISLANLDAIMPNIECIFVTVMNGVSLNIVCMNANGCNVILALFGRHILVRAINGAKNIPSRKYFLEIIFRNLFRLKSTQSNISLSELKNKQWNHVPSPIDNNNHSNVGGRFIFTKFWNNCNFAANGTKRNIWFFPHSHQLNWIPLI